MALRHSGDLIRHRIRLSNLARLGPFDLAVRRSIIHSLDDRLWDLRLARRLRRASRTAKTAHCAALRAAARPLAVWDDLHLIRDRI